MTDSTASAPKRWQIATAFAAVYLIWGSTYLGIAFAIETLPPLLMTGARFVAAGLVLYSWARLRGAPRPEVAHWRSAGVLGVLFFLCGNGAVTWVEQWMSSGLTAVLVAMVTAWTVLLEWFRPGGKRPPPAVLVGIVTGFFGVALLLLPGRVTGPKDVNLAGALTLMVSSFLWAVGSIYSQKATLPRHIGLTSGMQMLVGGGLLLLAGTLVGEWPQLHLQSVSPKSVFAFLYLFSVGSLIGFTAFSWLLKVSTPSKVSTYGYVNPVFAVLLGWAFAGEVLTLRSLAAAAVILGSVAVIITGRSMGRGPVSRLQPLTTPRLDRAEAVAALTPDP